LEKIFSFIEKLDQLDVPKNYF